MRVRMLGLAAVLAAPAPAYAANCDALRYLALPRVEITGAASVAAGGSLPFKTFDNQPATLPFGVCSITATARPTGDSDIRIAVMIPAGEAWNGKFVQVGNGGFAGQIPYGTMLLALSAGYAVAGTDDGHQDADWTSAKWGMGHPEKVRDFGVRAVKTTTDTAKAIIRRYAGAPPKRAYFFGCSDGGREALMTAQRYPDDFEGIVAGAPAYYWTNALGQAGLATKVTLQPGRALPPAKLPALQAAALKACGNGQGWIVDPRTCRFDPVVLACKGAETDGCLTSGQVATARMIYRGNRDTITGKPFPGLQPGAEAAPGSWAQWGVATAESDTARAKGKGIVWNHFAYLVKEDPEFDVRNLTEADVLAGDRKLRAVLNADSADLSAFKARGGKLLHFHGWNDPAIPPGLSTDYFARVAKTMGPTGGFYQLYMVPGMLHCAGGASPTNVNWLRLLDQWVETGTAPGSITATKPGSPATQLLQPEGK